VRGSDSFDVLDAAYLQPTLVDGSCRSLHVIGIGLASQRLPAHMACPSGAHCRNPGIHWPQCHHVEIGVRLLDYVAQAGAQLGRPLDGLQALGMQLGTA
jgi:hypothetical protein